MDEYDDRGHRRGPDLVEPACALVAAIVEFNLPASSVELAHVRGRVRASEQGRDAPVVGLRAGDADQAGLDALLPLAEHDVEVEREPIEVERAHLQQVVRDGLSFKLKQHALFIDGPLQPGSPAALETDDQGHAVPLALADQPEAGVAETDEQAKA